MSINIQQVPNAPGGYSLTGKKVMVHDQSAPLGSETVLVAATGFGGGGGVNSITAGTNITLGGTAADPIINATGGGSGITRTVVVTSGNITLGSAASTDYIIFVAGAHTLSMPAAAGNTNRYSIKNNHSANITINTAGAENIEGAASISIAPEESVDVVSDGTNWFII